MTTRQWLSLDAAIQYARGYGEEADVLSSPMGATFVVVPIVYTPLWRGHGFKVVAQIRFQVHVFKMVGDEFVHESEVPVP